MNELLNDSAKITFFVMLFMIYSEIAMAIIFFIKVKNFVYNAKTAKAEVIKIIKFRKGSQVTIQFKDPLGKLYEKTTGVPICTLEEKDIIEILYESKSDKVKYKSFLSLWTIPCLFMFSAFTTSLILIFLTYAGIANSPF
jgi:hypothetical protein